MKIYTKHTLQQILFVLGKHLTFDQCNITKELMSLIAGRIRKPASYSVANDICNLIDKYTDCYFKLKDFNEIASQLIIPVTKS